MNASEHLTRKQLSDYSLGVLEGAAFDEMGRHLLGCNACLAALPVPTSIQFRNALFQESNKNQPEAVLMNFLSIRLWKPSIFSAIGHKQTLAWTALALLLVSCASTLLWLRTDNESNSGDYTAKSEAINSRESNEPFPMQPAADIDKIPNIEERKHIGYEAVIRQTTRNRSLSDDTMSDDMQDRELTQLLENTPESVMSLRPAPQPILRGRPDEVSNAQRTFVLSGPVGITVLETYPEFRWEKVNDATGYQISIFDSQFNEILSSNVAENRFKAGQQLKRGEKYLWRVVAKLADQDVVAPHPPQPPAMFRIAPIEAEAVISTLKERRDQRFELAVFYSKEGMLDLAKELLHDILATNPRNRNAKRLLLQVGKWERENQKQIQRCDPTATNPDQ